MSEPNQNDAKTRKHLIGKIVAVLVIIIALAALYVYTPQYSLTTLLSETDQALTKIVIVPIATDEIEATEVTILDDEASIKAFVEAADQIGFRRAAPFTVRTFAAYPDAQYYVFATRADGSEASYLSVKGGMINLRGSFFDRFKKLAGDAEALFYQTVYGEIAGE
ncbi:MAG TPA: hypothetical protein GXZ89_08460 [Fastidiosipila sp.]|nr:hypothetical protein [Fastidiosipila sp.]